MNHRRKTQTRLIEKAVALFVVFATLQVSAPAATFVSNPDKLWPGGVVYYRFLDDLRNVSVCEDSDPTVACDPANGTDDCSIFVACIPVTSGWCLGGDSASFNWPSCDTTNGNADCSSAGVTGGQCVLTTMSAMCVAMKLWAAEANLTFIEFDCPNGQPTCPGMSCVEGTPSHYITMRSTSGPSSFSDSVGRSSGSQQYINVKLREGWIGKFGMAHELGHALGLYHEQQRPDRDTYLDVDTSLVTSGLEGNFSKQSSASFYPRVEHNTATPFDFDSLMMYALCRFSVCGDSCTGDSSICVNDPGNCRPMQRIWPWTGSDNCCGVPSGDPCIGQRNHFSDMDALAMKFLYPQSGWRFVDWVYDGSTEAGTFIQPYRAFPDGADVTPSGGTLWVQPGSYSSVGSYSNAMTVRAPIGPVNLGG